MYVLSPSLTMGMLVVVSTVIVGGTMIGTLLRGISRVAQQHATQVTTLRYAKIDYSYVNTWFKSLVWTLYEIDYVLTVLGLTHYFFN